MPKSWDDIKREEFDPFKFNTVTNVYIASQKVIVQRGCNSFQASNVGDTIAFVNGVILFPSATPATVPGDSISFGGNRGETYQGDLTVVFQAPVGALPRVEITQKYYLAFEV